MITKVKSTLRVPAPLAKRTLHYKSIWKPLLSCVFAIMQMH